ncbi:MAG TPA: hypothetical protein VI199_06720 [Novosphingobium sp.]
MIHGLYRTRDRLLGICVRVSWSAGDAAPILPRELYKELGGQPPFEELPTRAEYRRQHEGPAPDPFELP